MGVYELTTVNEKKKRPEREYSCWTRGWGKYFMNERKLIWAATARFRIHVGWGFGIPKFSVQQSVFGYYPI